MQIFGYGNLFLGLSFIHLGYMIRQYKDSLNKWYLGIPAILLFWGIAIYAPQRLEFVRNILVQGNWITNYLYTVLACYLMWFISQRWNHNNALGKAFIYLGRNSLVILCFFCRKFDNFNNAILIVELYFKKKFSCIIRSVYKSNYIVGKS